MADKNFFFIRAFLLISILIIFFWATNNILKAAIQIRSIAVAEKILPCINTVMPVSTIVGQMRAKQYQKISSQLQQAEWGNLRITICEEFLSIGEPYSNVTFSERVGFYPVFNISIPQVKRIDSLVYDLYFMACATMAIVVFMVSIYKNSNNILLIYLFLFILGALWLSLPVNQQIFSTLCSEEKSGNLNWKEIKIENDRLRLQWAEIAPFTYIYKNNPQLQTYFNRYNPHASWQIIGMDYQLCRYDSIRNIIDRIQLLSLWISSFWVAVWLYILYQVARIFLQRKGQCPIFCAHLLLSDYR